MKDAVISIRGCFECPYNTFEYGKTLSGKLTDNPDYFKRYCRAVKIDGEYPDVKCFHVMAQLIVDRDADNIPDFCVLRKSNIVLHLSEGAYNAKEI